PGQIALFRERDRFLIAADAFVTVKQDSLYKVLIQKEEVHGPPVYLTTNWELARESVQRLEALKANYVITGHGQEMEGEQLWEGLRNLVLNFDEVAVPSHGKFVSDERKEYAIKCSRLYIQNFKHQVPGTQCQIPNTTYTGTKKKAIKFEVSIPINKPGETFHQTYFFVLRTNSLKSFILTS